MNTKDCNDLLNLRAVIAQALEGLDRIENPCTEVFVVQQELRAGLVMGMVNTNLTVRKCLCYNAQAQKNESHGTT